MSAFVPCTIYSKVILVVNPRERRKGGSKGIKRMQDSVELN